MQKKRIIFCILAMLVAFVLVTPVHAFLINKGEDIAGNRLIYDTDTDLTWYDYTKSPLAQVDMNAWASSLTVTFGEIDYSDWRLPSASPYAEGYNIINQEQGNLYYTALGNTAGSGPKNWGPFENLLANTYWAKESKSGFPTRGWTWANQIGAYEDDVPRSMGLYGMAVMQGEVSSPVPEPATIALLGIGLAGLAGGAVRRKMIRKANS